MNAARAIACICLCLCAVLARVESVAAAEGGAPAAGRLSGTARLPGTETKEIDVIDALGRGWGEKELQALLAAFRVEGRPSFKRDDVTAFLQNRALGIELTFRRSDALDVPQRESPPGPFVLGNIRLYGPGSRTHAAFTGDLPFGLRFGDTREALIGKFGPPDSEGINLASMHSMRWDTERYALFALLDPSTGALALVALQLPVVASGRPGFEKR